MSTPPSFRAFMFGTALALLAADSGINTLNIDLVGLAMTGIAFQP